MVVSITIHKKTFAQQYVIETILKIGPTFAEVTIKNKVSVFYWDTVYNM